MTRSTSKPRAAATCARPSTTSTNTSSPGANMPTRYPPNRHPTPFEQHADQVLERAAKSCCKLSQVLDKVRDSGKAENISPAVQERIAKVRKPGDEEVASYAIEMALQYGAEYIDDDAEIIAMTDSRLADMMMVLGYGRAPKPERPVTRV